MGFDNVPSFANRQFAAVYEWAKQPKFGDSFDRVGDKDFEWPVPPQLLKLVPAITAKTHTVVIGAQKVTDPLTMIGIEPGRIIAEFIMHLKQAELQLQYSISKRDRRLKASNQELRPMLLPMRDDELTFKGNLETHGRDHCWSLAMSSRSQLTRRLYKDTHIRIVPLHFSATPGASASKAKAEPQSGTTGGVGRRSAALVSWLVFAQIWNNTLLLSHTGRLKCKAFPPCPMAPTSL